MTGFRVLSNSLMTKIILGITISLFILTSIGTYIINDRKDYIVKINGQKITNADLEQVFNNELNHQKIILGNHFYTAIKNDLYLNRLHQQSLVYLIDKLLLDDYANNLHLYVNDDQVKSVIFDQKIFQVDGKFNNNKYNTLINRLGLTADQYADILRKELSTQQLFQGIMNSDFLLPNEIKKLADMIAQKRNIRQAVINTSVLARKQHVNNNEIEQYYKEYKNDFLIPEKFRVSYIKLSSNNIKQIVHESDIEKWYNNHKEEYLIPGKNRYKIIQTKNEIDAKYVLNQLNQGVSFSKLAKTISVDPISAPKGGDLGWIELSSIPKEIKFSGLKNKGQISDIIKLSNGYLIVSLDDVVHSTIQPISEVRDNIIKKIKQQNITKLFTQLNEKVSMAALKNNESLKIAESVAGVKIIKTKWFSINSIPKEINCDSVKNILYNGILHTNSNLIELDDKNSIIVRIDEHKERSIQPMSQAKLKIINIIKRKKAYQQAKLIAYKILNSKDKIKTLSVLGIHLSNYKLIGHNINDPINQKAFSIAITDKNKHSWGQTEDAQGNIVLIMLDKVIPSHLPSDKTYELMRIIIKSNNEVTLKMLLDNLSKHASIKYNNNLEKFI
ncbi:peptidylprolyl isomerase [Candidatus Pantoea edessiphila]|uniref:Periplasmic chaperone PpiD n=1 Tax=Candidatus Pantoea edessiphila TaxID=2044610 RepID=A0A2P5SVH9_9GAMM|nr:peptidylprolyl isomerase [Candidatus Pantoea edessiphila]PPI86326.1 peptidylprolyl isomerase [Candidatus Pantoea edessiphila]